MTVVTLQDHPPERSSLTSYDEEHLGAYIRLLDADTEGADWREAVKIILGIDPEKEPERAQAVHKSNLARARWMSKEGYRKLLEPPTASSLRSA